MNNFILNPAVAGIENYWDVKASHRIQWMGIQDAPVTTYFTIHGPLDKDAYGRSNTTSMRTPGENPRGAAYWREYEATEPHHGVGLTIINDKTGPLNRFAAYGTYAYHLGIAPRLSLSAGISAGITNISLNAQQLDFGSVIIDPAVATSGLINRYKPDISAGLWLYASNFFVGLSAQQIVPQPISFAENQVTVKDSKLVPHLFFTAGYRIDVSEYLNVLPSVLLRYVNPLPLGVDLNAKVQYLDLIWLGGSYRFKDGFAAMVGMNLSANMNIGYSYDIQTSSLNRASRGTHELLIGFQLGNRYGDWCPRNLW